MLCTIYFLIIFFSLLKKPKIIGKRRSIGILDMYGFEVFEVINAINIYDELIISSSFTIIILCFIAKRF